MKSEETLSQARQQVLKVAGQLFGERGYTAVTMRDIADALHIRQASLYYHAPGGKEQLFIEVTERSLESHRQGLEQALESAEPAIQAQLQGAASWLLSQPPLDLTRLFRTDLPAISEQQSYRLTKVAYHALLTPLERVITAAYERGEVRYADPTLMAGSFLSVIESIHDMHRYTQTPKPVLAQDIIEVLLDGLRRR